MTLKEMINSPDAKKLYRELMKLHHPDIQGKSDKVAKQVTKDARELSNHVFLKKYGSSRFTDQHEPYNDLDRDVLWNNVKKWIQNAYVKDGLPAGSYMVPRRTETGQIRVDITIMGNLFYVFIKPKEVKTEAQFINKIIKTLDQY